MISQFPDAVFGCFLAKTIAKKPSKYSYCFFAIKDLFLFRFNRVGSV